MPTISLNDDEQKLLLSIIEDYVAHLNSQTQDDEDFMAILQEEIGDAWRLYRSCGGSMP